MAGLVEHGTAKQAYKAINPHVTDRSAEVLGSKAVSKIEHEDINILYERIGCTKEIVLTGLWERMQKTRKDSDFAKMTTLLIKIGGWDSRKNALADLLRTDLDLVEVIKIRLRKSKPKNELQDIVDIPCTSKDDVVIDANSDGTATSNQ